jgi:hypothetical protein
MKIERKIISNFLKKILLGGGVQECVADFCDDGLKILVSNVSNTAMINGLLKKEIFIEYESIGKIGIVMLDKLISIISNGFDDDIIEIKIEGNVLVIKSSNGNRIVETELASIEVLTIPKFDNTEFKKSINFKIDCKIINNLISKINNINRECNIKLELKEKNKFVISNSGTYRFTEKIIISELDISEDQNVEVKFGEPFFESIKMLDSDIQFYVRTDYPVFIVEEIGNESKIEILVAPRVNNDE